MHEDIKKKILNLVENYYSISVSLIIKELKIKKDLAERVLEEMKKKDGILIEEYNENLLKVYKIKKEMSTEERDVLGRLK